MKKGFTLVELISCFVIITLIFLITYPNIQKYINTSKENLYEQQVNTIEEAAKKWGRENVFDLPEEGKYRYLTLDELKKDGLLTNSEIKDPRTKKAMTGCVVVSFDKESNQYLFDYYEKCLED